MKEGVPEKHVLGLAPCSVDDDDVLLISHQVFIQILQVLSLWPWIEEKGSTVLAHSSQFWIPIHLEKHESTKAQGFLLPKAIVE